MIQAYSHREHFPLMKSWLDQRRQFGLEKSMLPKTGLVIDYSAIAFLVKTDTPVCWIAHFCCSPALGKEERELAFAKLISELEGLGKRLGYKIIQTCARLDGNLKNTIQKSGFTSFGDFQFFAKGLETLCP